MTDELVEMVLRELGDRIKSYGITEENTTHFNKKLEELNVGRRYRNQFFYTEIPNGSSFILKKQTVIDGEKHKLQRESEILLELQSEYLFHRYAVFLGNNCLYILMKAYLLPDGNPNTLDTLLQRKGGFSLFKSLQYIVNIRNGINYLHTLKLSLATGKMGAVIHRDLKPENIFIEKDGKLVIGDFEFSTIASKSYAYYNGSVEYWAPEIGIDEITEHFFSSDIYSFATMIFDMLSENPHELGKSNFWNGYGRDEIKERKRAQKSVDEVFAIRRKEFRYRKILDVLQVAMRTNPDKRYSDVNVFFNDFLLAKALEEMKDTNLKKRLSDLEEIIKGQKETKHKVTCVEKVFGAKETYNGETDPSEFLRRIKINFKITPDKLNFLSSDIMDERYKLFQALSEYLKRPLKDFDLNDTVLDESLGALSGVNNRIRFDIFWMMAYLSQTILMSEVEKYREMDAEDKSKFLWEKLGKDYTDFERIHNEASRFWKAYQGKK